MKKLAPLVVVVALLAACSGEPEPVPTVTVTAETTVTATVETTVATTTEVTVAAEPAQASEAPRAGSSLAVGDTLTLEKLTLTVVEAGESAAFGDPVYGWKIQGCNTTSDEDIAISAETWLGVDAEGGRIRPAPVIGLDDDSFVPEYPMYPTQAEALATPGDCVTGWMVFKDPKPVELRYRNDFGDSATWGVS